MTQFKRDVLQPAFDGALLENKYVKATLFIFKTRALRNSEIKKLYRTLDNETTTLCYVSADRQIYELINDPSGDTTTDADWQQLDFGVSEILIARGTWNVSNTDPVLADSDAIGAGNDFYTVTGAPTPVVVQFPDLFQGQAVEVKDGDWIISNGEYWFVSQAPIDWNSISNIPTVIDEYVGGQVIAHPHVISDITGLQAALDEKYDESDTASLTQAFSLIPNEKITTLGFLRQYYYRKYEVGVSKTDSSYSALEIDTLLSNLIVQNQDPPFDWNRPIRKLPKVGDVPTGTKLGEGIEEIYFGTKLSDAEIDSIDPMEQGALAQTRLRGKVYKNDGTVSSIQIIDKADAIAAVVPLDTNDPQFIDLNLPAVVPDEADAPAYRIRIVTDYGSGSVQVDSAQVEVKVIYPYLWFMGSENEIGANIYSLSSKEVDIQKAVIKTLYGGSNQHIYFCYPADYPALLEAVDDEGVNVLGAFKPVRTENIDSVGLDTNWSKSYKIYEYTYPTSVTSENIDYYLSDPVIKTSDDVPEGNTNLYLSPAERGKLSDLPDASVVGDMKQSVYDLNGDGIVSAAAELEFTGVNNTGFTINAGSLVDVTGEVDLINSTVDIRLAQIDALENLAVGIALETMLDGETGKIGRYSVYTPIDTTGRSVGDPIYAGPSGTILFEPPATGIEQAVGNVVVVDVAGIVSITPQASYDIYGSLKEWQPFTFYPKNAVVVYNGGEYKAFWSTIAHTSDANFQDDLTAGRWELISGDMRKAVYDPTGVAADAFSMDNMVETPTKKVMTDQERTKLAGLQPSTFKGTFPDPATLRASFPTAQDGDSADVISTLTKWLWNSAGTPVPPEVGGSWEDSGQAFGGDMQKSVYDPTNVAKDAFFIDNHVEGINNKFFTAANQSKLAGIEDNATADQTPAEIKLAYESNADTNEFNDTEKLKLGGIEDNAEVNQSDAEIKTQYENNANTNAFTDADKSKLDGIATGADMLKSTYDTDDSGTVDTAEDIITFAANDTGGVVDVGKAVIITSADVTARRFELSDANPVNNKDYVTGITLASSNNGEVVAIAVRGIHEFPNFAGFNVGDFLFLSTTTAGDIQNTIPTATDAATPIYIGSIVGRVGQVDYVDIANIVGLPASTIRYDNSNSDIVAEDVKGALDELSKPLVMGGIKRAVAGTALIAGSGEITAGFASFVNLGLTSNPSAGRLAVDQNANVMCIVDYSAEHLASGQTSFFTIHVNGVAVVDAQARNSSPSGNQGNPSDAGKGISVPLQLNAGDYVSVFHTGDAITLYGLQINLQGQKQ